MPRKSRQKLATVRVGSDAANSSPQLDAVTSIVPESPDEIPGSDVGGMAAGSRWPASMQRAAGCKRVRAFAMRVRSLASHDVKLANS